MLRAGTSSSKVPARHLAVRGPATANDQIDTYCSDDKNMTALATSGAVPARPIGTFLIARLCRLSSSGSVIPVTRYKLLKTKDGATALILIPNGANSSAHDFVNISKPALHIEYPIRPGSGRLPLSQLTLITTPLDSLRNSRKKFVIKKGVLTWISVK